jgi:hypothetical protein
MKKYFFVLMAFLPIALAAQTSTNVSEILPVSKPAQIERRALPELLSQLATNANKNNYRFFQINEEMFKAFCNLKDADSTSVALFRKIKSVCMLERVLTLAEKKKLRANELPYDSTLWNSVLNYADLAGYTVLLKSTTYSALTKFLKKEYGPGDNEFLLITDKMVIDIRGDIQINTIYEMQRVLRYVQQMLPN